MALPQNLGPPPDPKDPRFLQWLALLWAAVGQSQGSDASQTLAIDAFAKARPISGSAEDVAEKKIILAGQIFGD